MNRVLILCLSFASILVPFGTLSPAAAPDAADAKQAALLIGKLDDQEYQVRVESERKLRRLGIEAIPVLQGALHHDSPEIALRAKKLLAVAQQRLLTKLKVRLEIKPDRVGWNEPFDLIVTFKNPTAYDMALPLLPETPDVQNTDAAQVGAMLNIADDLDVVGPDGREIELHLIDIKEDPAVDREVNRRLNVTENVRLPAGESHARTIPAFNRGWARYRMLRKGIYQIRYWFKSDPATPGDDQTAINVMSNDANVSITSDAPVAVQDTGVKLRADLTLRNGVLHLTVTNTYDQPVVLHTDTGQPLARYASIRWWVNVDETQRVVTDWPPSNQGPDAEPYLTLAPAQKVEILRKPLADFWTLPGLPRIARGESVLITAVYLNFYSRSTLRTKPLLLIPAEKLRQQVESLPLFVYTGSAVSNQITLTRKDSATK